MRFYVYILYSKELDRYYIGSTFNIQERLNKHLSSTKGFTSKAKDWELKYQEIFDNRSEALKREFQIKKWKSRKMIERLLEN